jgi:tRNA 2-thiouridine synthesizing protein B
MILHKISSSPYADCALKQCLKRISPEDGLLLIQDGVYAIKHQDFLQSLEQVSNVYLLENDLNARAISSENPKFTQISYEQFVDLTLQYSKVLSW